ncbi:MAG TPA: hypothetical protein VMW20_03520 [Candidatus Nanoarchaeia archaeon]|nr:hypothetical protein [Candidatus Nanoarchaeia archaeon]
MSRDKGLDGKLKAITVLKLEKQRIGWSPKLKRSVFIDESTNIETIQELKRLREADVLTVYDQLEDRTMFLELDALERVQFDEVYSRYLELGGQVIYSRKKKGRKTHTLFRLDEEYGKTAEMDVPEKKSLF